MYTGDVSGVSWRAGGDDRADRGESRFARSYRRHGFTVLELRGEIDLAAQLDVGPYLDMITGVPGPRVVVDLCPTEFLDCSGLRLLVRARLRTADRDGELRLVCPETAAAHRILRHCGLLGALEPVPTLADALSDDYPGAVARPV
ncbi:anti-sigma factor antagonist [Streptomyces sp. MAR4 CNX-425]|uniref:anti-sigma factor antagonist n=1 Tax=Streptomyces sp. MAR4 CNX-425 TaxID=3406343 RepID=UPI003B5045AC